jgi:hypothetical protein
MIEPGTRRGEPDELAAWFRAYKSAGPSRRLVGTESRDVSYPHASQGGLP